MKTNQSANSKHRRLIQFFRLIMTFMIAVSLTLNVQQPVQAAVTLTLTPLTWNVIGLDSNKVADGPNNFPVGARVCNTGDTAATNITSAFVWDTTSPYINLRPGSLGTAGNPYPTITTLSANGQPGSCTDIYYEVEVTRTNAAYNTSARYHITATTNGITYSTITPRELYVKALVSQNRNSNFSLELDDVAILDKGTMNMYVGETYKIELFSDTATNGYEQIESFINFPNTIFQIKSVTSTYTAAPGTPPVGTIDRLYYDACTWENNPTSTDYLSCLGTGKAGGQIINTYIIKIISGGGTSMNLHNLIYDFSGNSYHYNDDYSATYRIGNIITPIMDYGDFPAVYNNTTQDENGARHLLGSVYMGPTVTQDTTNNESDFATKDTDDGVTRDSATPWVNGANVNVLVNLSTTTFSGPVSVGIWVDWKAGDTNYNFAFFPCPNLTPGAVRTCTITVPPLAEYVVGTPVFVRVRAFDQANLVGGSLDAGDIVGLSNNGEVEDYWWDFSPTSVTLASFSARPAGLPFSLLALAALLVLALGGIALFIRRKHLSSR